MPDVQTDTPRSAMKQIMRWLRALPTLMRIGMSEAMAYRAEMLVWVFATTMPLISLVMWQAVAEFSPVKTANGQTFTSGRFVAYFLCTFIVRQLVSSWAAWEISYEIRQGILGMRLLRPLHPVISYLVQNLAFIPLRLLVTVPIIAVLIFSSGAEYVTRDASTWLLWLVSLFGGWCIIFFANIAIGALTFHLESSVKIMDVWLAGFFVFSGYLFPLDLFPNWLRTVAEYLPFRYQLGLPVELMTQVHTVESALPVLAKQYAWAVAMVVIALTTWKSGVKRFQAFGG
jgi:ABC-2 type transport system permease protein